VHVKSLKQNISLMEQEEFKTETRSSNETCLGKNQFIALLTLDKEGENSFFSHFYLFLEFLF